MNNPVDESGEGAGFGVETPMVTEKMIEAARDKFKELSGIQIYLPGEGTLDDFEQGRYDALVAAIEAALSTDAEPVSEPLELPYKNWRGEISTRKIQPIRLEFGSTEWHPEPQWLLVATDIEKGAERSFALKDFNPPQSATSKRTLDDIVEDCLRIWFWNYDKIDEDAKEDYRVPMRQIVSLVALSHPAAPSVAVEALEEIKPHLLVYNLIMEAMNEGVAKATDPAWTAKDFTKSEYYNLILSALSAQVQDARSDDEEEIYEIGVREGYERAVQEIDIKTGGDGEYRYCTDHDPERHTPDAPAMIQRIVDRFETLNMIGEAEKRGDFWDVPGSAQVQDVAEDSAKKEFAASARAMRQLADHGPDDDLRDAMREMSHRMFRVLGGLSPSAIPAAPAAKLEGKP